MTLLLFYLFLAIFVSFFCSISEAILLSVRPTYVATLERKSARGAKALKKLRSNLDRPLAAILTANTIAHTVGAAGVGAQSAVVFGSAYIGATSAILTLLILVFSEIIPKTLGATHWRTLAPVFGPLIHGLTVTFLPFVWLSERLTRLISRSGSRGFTFSRDEMEAMAEIGVREGLLQTKELKIVSNLMRLQSLSARDIMTPRSVIFSAPADLTVQEYFLRYSTKQFSRIPIYKTNSDDVIGFVLKTDLLMAQAKDEFNRPLSDFRREYLALLDNVTASDVFDRLMHEKSHIALLVDEYGTVQGLVTLEDVVETLIGLEIMDELDTVEDMQVLANRRWRDRMTALGIDPDSLNTERN
ncbi:hemolysin family protein [Hyphococcus sp.]|uniref:hemolysin family protein n=1 Tax=Hyphococcus sp. TaxID=2038636 RepID=UPI003CCBDCF5